MTAPTPMKDPNKEAVDRMMNQIKDNQELSNHKPIFAPTQTTADRFKEKFPDDRFLSFGFGGHIPINPVTPHGILSFIEEEKERAYVKGRNESSNPITATEIMIRERDMEYVENAKKQLVAQTKREAREEILEALLEKARKTDYADRTEYDVAYDFIKKLGQKNENKRNNK